jgi:hypothetical protein
MASSNINYKPLFLDKLLEYTENLPEYSLGEMFHSIVTQLSRAGIDITKKSDLLNITDKQFYSAIDKSIKDETE